jgi:hypothetical protein
MTPLVAFFRNVERQAFWLQLAPRLHVDQPSPSTFSDSAGTLARLSPLDSDHWRTSGYVRLPSLLNPSVSVSLAQAITTLHSHDLHPTFIYVYDEAWCVLDALRPHLSRLLGDDFDVLADVWAWHIDPRTDRGGWPIHRGWYEDVRDATDTPALLNVWIALTDATERNACIHLVPLSRDPHYPADLHNLGSLADLALALPAPAGSGLVWNANAAHWGGTCDPSFDQPRISMSFTVRRRAALPHDFSCIRPPLSFQQRLDLIASQFETYGHKELSADRLEMRWAALLRGMRAAARR